MSKTITVSDETYEKIKSQIKEEGETKDNYPIASIITNKERIVLNLPDICLSDKYKGRVIAVDSNGIIRHDFPKEQAFGHCYGIGDLEQVYPVD